MVKKVVLGVVLVALAVAVGVVVWMAVVNPGMQSESTPPDMQQNNAANNPGAITDGPQTQATVNIRNSSFTPHTVTIKKGGTVTWINDDTVRHNVIAAKADNSGGLPGSNPLLGKGESYQFTFNQVGTFDYLCAPHPFMTGSVKVVE